MADEQPGLRACGAYLPRLRIERTTIAAATAWAAPCGTPPTGRRTFCNWDEDSITMAVEAARDCLGDVDRGTIGWVGLASTTLPFADRSNAGVAAAALDLREDCTTIDFASSRRAGTGALLAALDRRRVDDALVVAADRRSAPPGSPPELAYGHGAAAALVGRGAGLIAELIGHASLSVDFVDQHRETGREFDYALEERWVRDEGHLKLLPRTIAAALGRAGIDAGQVAHFIAPTSARTAQAVARAARLPPASVVGDLRDECGDTGTPHPLLLLARCLGRASPGDLILVTGFGQGCDALVLRATDHVRSSGRPGLDAALAGGIVDGDYLRFLSHCGVVEMDWGKRAERDTRTAQTVAWRRRRELLGLVGGRCARCGTVQYPKTHACVNPECRAFDTQEDHPLAESGGSVKSFTEDWLAYTRDPPLVYGNVTLAGGGNLFAEFADTRSGELAVGTPIRFVFRVKDVDPVRGVSSLFLEGRVREALIVATGIRDKVAIVGMGCSRFGERWEAGSEDLMYEAFVECVSDAGVDRDRIDAAWLGVFYQEQSTSKSGLPLSMALRLPNVPVTRVENLCATGTEALRGAAYAVASGAVDVALAMGVEKLKDTGFAGLPERTKGTFEDLWQPGFTPPGAFAQLASAYAARHGHSMDILKRAMAHVSWKSHENAAGNPRAHLRNRISIEQVLSAPMIAWPLGLYDCCGVSDGAACAIVTTPAIAASLGKRDMVTIKALQLVASNGVELGHSSWDGSHTLTTRLAAERAFDEASMGDPRRQIGLAEVHDCFSITELVLMEDLGLSEQGRAVHDIQDGRYDRDGAIPCQTDGGLKCFGHPVGASGLRMAYEIYSQLLGRAGERQAGSPALGLTHNLGGIPSRNVASVSVLGLHRY